MYSVIINSTRSKVNWECELPWRHVALDAFLFSFATLYCNTVEVDTRFKWRIWRLFYICRRIIMLTRMSFWRFLSRWAIICISRTRSTRSFVNLINFNGRTFEIKISKPLFFLLFFFNVTFMHFYENTSICRKKDKKFQNIIISIINLFNIFFPSYVNRKIFRN